MLINHIRTGSQKGEIKLNGKWQFSYLGYAKGDGNSKTLANFPVTSIAEAVEKYLESW